MTKKFRLALAALAIAASGAAHADYIDLGSITAPELVNFGNSWIYTEPTNFVDEFAFTLTNAASAYGMILEGNWWFGQTDVQLLSLVSNTYINFDFSPGHFSFTGLTAGAYSLFVSGNTSGFLTGYTGTMDFRPAAARVPEPGTLALFGVGLVALAFMAMRRRVRG
jgi:hypothetical protein